MIDVQFQSIAQSAVARMLNSIPDAIVLTSVVWAYCRLLPRHNSGVRFTTWLLALLGVAVLPIFVGLHFGASDSSALPTANLHRELVLGSRWAESLFTAWAIGATLMLVRLGIGLWRLSGCRNRCMPIDRAIVEPAVAEVLTSFGAKEQVELRISAEFSTPAVIGLLKPEIVFPAWLLPQLSAAEIQIILLHEFAHVRRRDHWSNLAQQFVKALLFFHPAVWWIEHRLTLERELACDDLVLQSASPKAYASFLISVAEKLQNTRALALAETLVSRMHQLSVRVAQILDARRPNRSADWKPAVGVGAALVALVFSAAPSMPRIVRFQASPLRGAARMPATQTSVGAQPPAIKVKALPQTIAAANGRDTHALPLAREVTHALEPMAITADYHPRTASAFATATRSPHAAAAPTTAIRKKHPDNEMIIIMETLAPGGDSGVSIHCVWSVDGRAEGTIVFAI